MSSILTEVKQKLNQDWIQVSNEEAMSIIDIFQKMSRAIVSHLSETTYQGFKKFNITIDTILIIWSLKNWTECTVLSLDVLNHKWDKVMDFNESNMKIYPRDNEINKIVTWAMSRCTIRCRWKHHFVEGNSKITVNDNAEYNTTIDNLKFNKINNNYKCQASVSYTAG